MSDFELVAPPDDVKPVGARVSTQKLYEQWVQLSEIHGHGHNSKHSKSTDGQVSVGNRAGVLVAG